MTSQRIGVQDWLNSSISSLNFCYRHLYGTHRNKERERKKEILSKAFWRDKALGGNRKMCYNELDVDLQHDSYIILLKANLGFLAMQSNNSLPTVSFHSSKPMDGPGGTIYLDNLPCPSCHPPQPPMFSWVVYFQNCLAWGAPARLCTPTLLKLLPPSKTTQNKGCSPGHLDCFENQILPPTSGHLKAFLLRDTAYVNIFVLFVRGMIMSCVA